MTQFTRRRNSAPIQYSAAELARKELHQKLVFENGAQYNNLSEMYSVKNGAMQYKNGEAVWFPPAGKTVEEFKVELGVA